MFITETITVEPWTNEDGAGKPVYGAPVSVPAVIQGPNRRYIDPAGQQVVPRSHAYVGPSPIVGVKDRVTLANGTVPSLLGVDEMNWGPELDHQVLNFA